jgi:hypothetical protein
LTHIQEARRCGTPSWILQSTKASSGLESAIPPKLALFPLYRQGTFGKKSENVSLFRLYQVSEWLLGAPSHAVSLQHAEVIDPDATAHTLQDRVERYCNLHFDTNKLSLTFSYVTLEKREAVCCSFSNLDLVTTYLIYPSQLQRIGNFFLRHRQKCLNSRSG